MPRNGSFLGPRRLPTSNSAVGIWSLKDQQKADANGTWPGVAVPPPPPPTFSATGGTITTFGSYTLHSFTSPGTFTVTGGPKAMNIIVVAGGGGGGTGNGGFGGGGAGGLIYIPSASPVGAIGAGTYPVTVGGGGGPGSSGSDTTIGAPLSLTAKGGGSSTGSNGLSGGSAGGCDGDGGTNDPATQPTQAGNSGTFGYGNIGGQPGGGSPSGGGSYRAGGGGGAGGAGQPGAQTGAGGAGLGPTIGAGTWYPTTFGQSGVFAKGGQGGVRTAVGTPGGPANSGGGGGGGNENAGVQNSDSGSSGIVLIGYLT